MPLERTWGYRRLYVNAILECAPQRAVLAVYAEMLRLGFVVTASALFALVFALLASGAAGRGVLVWTIVAGTGATLASACAVLALWNVWRAACDLQRVRDAAGEGGNTPGEKPAT